MSMTKFCVWREGEYPRTFEGFIEHHAIERYCEDSENDGFGGDGMNCGSSFIVFVAKVGWAPKRFEVHVTKSYETVELKEEVQP